MPILRIDPDTDIVYVNDLHLEKPDPEVRLGYLNSIINLMTEAKKNEVQFILCGDTLDNKGKWEESRKKFRHARALFRRLNLPPIFLPGNHDTNMDPQVIVDELGCLPEDDVVSVQREKVRILLTHGWQVPEPDTWDCGQRATRDQRQSFDVMMSLYKRRKIFKHWMKKKEDGVDKELMKARYKGMRAVNNKILSAVLAEMASVKNTRAILWGHVHEPHWMEHETSKGVRVLSSGSSIQRRTRADNMPLVHLVEGNKVSLLRLNKTRQSFETLHSASLPLSDRINDDETT